LKIGELKAHQKEVNLTKVEVIEISPIKEFAKFGKPGRVCNAIIKDDSGQVSLTLWNEEIDEIKVGNFLDISNAFVKEWQGYLQLNTGRTGKFEIVK